MAELALRWLDSNAADFEAEFTRLLHWDLSDDGEIDQVVAPIIAAVRERGADAVLEYTRRFDAVQADNLDELEIPAEALQRAWEQLDSDTRRALQAAHQRIVTYHQHQVERSWSFEDGLGNVLGQKITPLDRVGVYVPGGQASYPSTVLMTIGPARVAGVGEVVVTVPTPQGERNATVLAALHLAGADRVFAVGGAQAVAALAYGAGSIPKVDKIVGPGSAFVASAKRQVFGQVGIDIIAGPSEVLILADGTSDPNWAALDLFSQAEHDAAAQAIMISPDAAFLAATRDQMHTLLPQMPRGEVIAASLAARGGLIKTADMNEAVELANRIAPEHLELHVADPDLYLDAIRHAGAIFCGAHAGETFGDYAAGPSHVLPTFGTARFASPLGVYDFCKRSSVIRMSKEGAAELADVAVPLATSEGLHAHARAAAVRVQDQN